MDLQLQIKRALIAFAIWAVLGGIALSRASAAAVPVDAAHAAHALTAPLVLTSASAADLRCGTRLRIEVTASLRVTVPCDRSCRPLRGLAEVLGMPVETQTGACVLRSA